MFSSPTHNKRYNLDVDWDLKCHVQVTWTWFYMFGLTPCSLTQTWNEYVFEVSILRYRYT